MTNSENNDLKSIVLQEVESITSKKETLISAGLLLLVFLFFPPFWIFGIPTIIFLIIWYQVGRAQDNRALTIARGHLPASATSMEIVESLGTADSIALNDWGLVYAKPGASPIQMSWNSMISVKETGLGIVVFKNAERELTINLSLNRYTHITEFIHSRIGNKAEFDIDVETGQSQLIARLKTSPKVWKKGKNKLTVDANGIDLNGQRMDWNEMTSVTEGHREIEDATPDRWFTFSSADRKIEVHADTFESSSELLLHTYFDTLRAIISEKLPKNSRLESQPLNPHERAKEELERGIDATKAAFAFAMKSKKFKMLEDDFFKPMLRVVDKYDLDYLASAQMFLEKYALVMRETGREKEAELLELRVRNRR